MRPADYGASSTCSSRTRTFASCKASTRPCPTVRRSASCPPSRGDSARVTCPAVETTRLLLRPFREDAVDAYPAMLRTPEVRASLHIVDDVSRYDAWIGLAQQL